MAAPENPFIDARNDQRFPTLTAAEIAREHSHEHALELWQQARRVQRFEPNAPE